MDSRIIAAGIVVVILAAAIVLLSQQQGSKVPTFPVAETPELVAPVVQELTEDQAAQAVEQELDSSLGEMTTEELEQALLAQ